MKVSSVADVRRIPVGTKLRVVRTLMGPCAPSGRIVKQARSRDVVLTIDDPGHKYCGQDSYLTFPAGTKVEPRDRGFAVIAGGEVACEYEFVEGA